MSYNHVPHDLTLEGLRVNFPHNLVYMVPYRGLYGCFRLNRAQKNMFGFGYVSGLCFGVCFGICFGVCFEVCFEICFEVCFEVCFGVCFVVLGS